MDIKDKLLYETNEILEDISKFKILSLTCKKAKKQKLEDAEKLENFKPLVQI